MEGNTLKYLISKKNLPMEHDQKFFMIKNPNNIKNAINIMRLLNQSM